MPSYYWALRDFYLSWIQCFIRYMYICNLQIFSLSLWFVFSFLFLSIFYWLCYYNCPNFFSPLHPHLIPASTTLQHSSPKFMSMGYTCKFFGFSVSYTILNLPLSILCLLIMLLLLCTFPPSLPSPSPLNSLFVMSISDSVPVLVVCLGFFFHSFSFFLGSVVDSCESVVILLLTGFDLFHLDKSL